MELDLVLHVSIGSRGRSLREMGEFTRLRFEVKLDLVTRCRIKVISCDWSSVQIPVFCEVNSVSVRLCHHLRVCVIIFYRSCCVKFIINRRRTLNNEHNLHYPRGIQEHQT